METVVIPSMPVRCFNAGEQLCLNTDLGTVKDDFGGIFLDPVQSFAGRLLSCLHLSIQFNPSVTGIVEIDLRRPGVIFAIPGLLPRAVQCARVLHLRTVRKCLQRGRRGLLFEFEPANLRVRDPKLLLGPGQPFTGFA